MIGTVAYTVTNMVGALTGQKKEKNNELVRDDIVTILMDAVKSKQKLIEDKEAQVDKLQEQMQELQIQIRNIRGQIQENRKDLQKLQEHLANLFIQPISQMNTEDSESDK